MSYLKKQLNKSKYKKIKAMKELIEEIIVDVSKSKASLFEKQNITGSLHKVIKDLPNKEICEECDGDGWVRYSCCGDDIKGNDIDLCPSCLEHCGDEQEECDICNGTGIKPDEEMQEEIKYCPFCKSTAISHSEKMTKGMANNFVCECDEFIN